MAVIGLLTERNSLTRDFFENIIYRSKHELGLAKNPFTMKTKLKTLPKKYFFVACLTPVYPPVFWFGFLLLVPFLVFKWFNFFLLLPFFLISLGFFWSSTFYLLVLRASLKKKGYKGVVKVLSKSEIVERLL